AIKEETIADFIEETENNIKEIVNLSENKLSFTFISDLARGWKEDIEQSKNYQDFKARKLTILSTLFEPQGLANFFGFYLSWTNKIDLDYINQSSTKLKEFQQILTKLLPMKKLSDIAQRMFSEEVLSLLLNHEARKTAIQALLALEKMAPICSELTNVIKNEIGVDYDDYLLDTDTEIGSEEWKAKRQELTEIAAIFKPAKIDEQLARTAGDFKPNVLAQLETKISAEGKIAHHREKFINKEGDELVKTINSVLVFDYLENLVEKFNRDVSLNSIFRNEQVNKFYWRVLKENQETYGDNLTTEEQRLLNEFREKLENNVYESEENSETNEDLIIARNNAVAAAEITAEQERLTDLIDKEGRIIDYNNLLEDINTARDEEAVNLLDERIDGLDYTGLETRTKNELKIAQTARKQVITEYTGAVNEINARLIRKIEDAHNGEKQAWINFFTGQRPAITNGEQRKRWIESGLTPTEAQKAYDKAHEHKKNNDPIITENFDPQAVVYDNLKKLHEFLANIYQNTSDRESKIFNEKKYDLVLNEIPAATTERLNALTPIINNQINYTWLPPHKTENALEAAVRTRQAVLTPDPEPQQTTGGGGGGTPQRTPNTTTATTTTPEVNPVSTFTPSGSNSPNSSPSGNNSGDSSPTSPVSSPGGSGGGGGYSGGGFTSSGGGGGSSSPTAPSPAGEPRPSSSSSTPSAPKPVVASPSASTPEQKLNEQIAQQTIEQYVSQQGLTNWSYDPQELEKLTTSQAVAQHVEQVTARARQQKLQALNSASIKPPTKKPLLP
ncbi:6801_t:CDS:2, partial [Funneliformis geosporum]